MRLRPGDRVFPHAPGNHGDVFEGDGVTSVLRTVEGLQLTTRLRVPNWTIGDGLLIMPCGELWSMPQTIMVAIIGRPITALLRHPLIDDRMTIASVTTSDVVQSWIGIEGTLIGVQDAIAIMEHGDRP